MPLTISLPTPEIWVAAILLGIAALSALIFWATTPWQSKERSDAPWPMRLFMAFLIVLVPIWALLIAATVVSLWNVLLHSDAPKSAEDARWSVAIIGGQMTALIALVSAPLALIRVYTTERQTRTAEQGHMTDRISKAVEQLGAEKTVKISGKDKDGNDKTIEETKPNIEVRIGGLLSLERISQDSVKYDKGRDHVRVMEIICAYVRENAPASGAQVSLRETYKTEEDRWDGDPDQFDEWFCSEHKLFQPDIQGFISVHSLEAWAYLLPHPRADIAMALQIICRRDEKQITLEEEHSRPYRLDLRRTNLQKAVLEKGDFQNAVLIGARMEGSYCDDANFTGAKLARAHLVCARAAKARFDHAFLESTDFTLAGLDDTSFHNCSGAFASFKSCQMHRTRITRDAPLEAGAVNRMNFENCQFLGAFFDNIRPNWAYNFHNQYLDQSTDFRGFKGAAFRNAVLPRH